MAYATRANVESIFGANNVSQWANRDNDGDGGKITAAIADALARAETRIDDRLREGPYAIPFTVTPEQVTEITAMLAGVLLYEWRRIVDLAGEEQGTPNPTAHHKKHVEEVIRDIHGGRVRFSAVDKTFTDYPKAVVDDS
jgi:phage gp36-like protein